MLEFLIAYAGAMTMASGLLVLAPLLLKLVKTLWYK